MPAKRPCAICSAIQQIRAGEVSNLVADLEHSYVVLGWSQFYRGYCLVMAKRHFTELHLMPPAEARALFDEVLVVGQAIANIVKPIKLNHECLGNEEPHVHWHIFPRQPTDPEPRRPVWVHPETLPRVELEPAEKNALIGALQLELKRLSRQPSSSA